jgi:hypothetical protein
MIMFRSGEAAEGSLDWCLSLTHESQYYQLTKSDSNNYVIRLFEAAQPLRVVWIGVLV